MKIEKNYNLTKLNTFGIKATAKFFTEINSEEELREVFNLPEFKNNQKLFLGGGSNVLFTKDFDGIVVLNKLKGIEIIEENEKNVLIRSMSGVVWHDLVLFTVEKGLWGIENLSFIPGSVGAAPMQNIGAYGAELKDVLVSVESYEIKTGNKRIFNAEECELGYRDSIFKNGLKGEYFISAIVLALSKVEKKNIEYRVLQEHLEKNKIEVKNSKDISEAVMSIRKSKLPDPNVIGNAGSFFKNVFLSKEKDKEKIKELVFNYPHISYFDEGDFIKIPAAWLIEECGWKGKKVNQAGVHDKQALVLVNHGGATGEEIKALSEEVITSVFEKFGLKLTPEVNLI
ncbi:UDP-N-acetylmuramate dehydrogenase [Candidatus Nomurabacteria bacterium]|nr:UDP-N-acetylmuramate dehydrogenase [Candidatus Nomurabacteria bacterium]